MAHMHQRTGCRAWCFLRPPDAAAVIKNDTDEQRRQQCKSCQDKAHVHSPHWKAFPFHLAPADADRDELIAVLGLRAG